ncbi:hypothetical protein IMCC3317_40600 [Kordia antarctica]|uniref:Uncharacterized protein n=1 Tax=Kordia antarctica TaxID=1218801 RepID=A0A7L4ZR48_9FLAO|nr:hypothetical protein [Kordia antarctica]QHI38666.1 hypothetical protein IMCC3317_40600 [Kordia antarctica]
MNAKTILKKKLLLFTLFIGLLLVNTGNVLSQNILCEPCTELSKYISPNRADYFILKSEYQPPKHLTKEWKKFPTVRKIEMAYAAFERKGNGEKFLAKLSTDIRKEIGAIGHEEILQPLFEVEIKKKLKFRYPKKYSQIELDKPIQKQILTISKYTETGALGGIRGVLRRMDLSEDLVYKILRKSNSFIDAFEQGLARAKIPPSQQERIRRLVQDLMKKHPAAKHDKKLVQFIERHKKMRDQITKIVIDELLSQNDIVAIFDIEDKKKSIIGSKKYQDFLKVAPDDEVKKLTLSSLKKTAASKTVCKEALFEVLKGNSSISDLSTHNTIDKFITSKTEEILVSSFNVTEEKISQDLKTSKKEFRQLFSHQTQNNEKLKLLMTELANTRMDNISNNTFAEIDLYYNKVDEHLNSISSDSRWEKIRKDFRERIKYDDMRFNKNQIGVFESVLEHWDRHKSKNKFKWYNNKIFNLEKQFYNFSKPSGKIKACWGFILQQQDWDGAAYHYLYIARDSKATGQPYYLLKYYYNSIWEGDNLNSLYNKNTDIWVGKLCPPH